MDETPLNYEWAAGRYLARAVIRTLTEIGHPDELNQEGFIAAAIATVIAKFRVEGTKPKRRKKEKRCKS